MNFSQFFHNSLILSSRKKPTTERLSDLLVCLCCRFEGGGGCGQQVAFWLDTPDPRERSFFRNAIELFYTYFEFFGQDSFWTASTFSFFFARLAKLLRLPTRAP